jgi:hypothetical protein
MKAKIKNAEDLDRAIAELELKAAAQKKDIQETFKVVSEDLKPLNLLKSGFRSVFSGDNKIDLANILLGLGSGFLSRKLFIGKSTGIVRKTVGKAVQWGMAGLVSKNAEKIKQKAGELIDKIFKRHRPGSNHTPASVSSPESKQITL